MKDIVDVERLRRSVRDIVDRAPVLDMHTHIYAPPFGELLLWGIDELLIYHYVLAEMFRTAPLPYDRFWAMSKTGQADYIWKHLFVERSPVSEACRGVLTLLHALGVDTSCRDLGPIRRFFAAQTVEKHVARVFELAGVSGVIMTNDPFDDAERPVWERGYARDPRFQAALRIDPLLNDWPNAAARLRQWGYDVRGDLGGIDVDGVRRFLADWIKRMQPRYLAVSLPPTFAFPEEGPRSTLIERCVLPAARDAGVPFAMMIGVRRG
ncbi:MAG TPA: glucuronate isomerase, partial [Phycisphaerae bacterium]|nr:glucuronate isomerase [Phycisphaerae bacterium]